MTQKSRSQRSSTVGGAGFAGCDVLDQAGVDRISGLAPLLPTLTGDPAPVIAASAAGFCPVTGPIWGDGNILLGGPGSDTITGRGANDIIDGDKELKVRISVRTVAADPATEIGSTDLMEHQYLHDAAGNLTGPTLQAAVFAGTVDPGNLVNVREIVSPTAADAASSVDTAVFAGPSSNYAITLDPGTATTLPSITVNQTGANVAGQRISDGIDTLRNIEQLKFGGDLGTEIIQASSITAVAGPVVTVPGAPTIGAATAGAGAATVSFTVPANTGGAAITGFTVVATPVAGSPATATTVTVPGAASSPAAVTGLTNGTAYTFQVLAVNSVGPGALSAPSNAVTPVLFVPITAPARPATPTATAANAQATVRWTAPANGGSAITSYTVQAFVGAAATPVRTVNLIPAGSVSTTVTGLTNGTGHTFQVRAVNAVGPGPFSLRSTAVTPATVPNAPAIGVAVAGAPGGAITATARWTPSATTGGAPITGFRISALRLNAAGAVLGTTTVTQTFATPPPIAARTLSVNLPVLGNYRFTVVTLNRVGSSAPSARSNLVAGR